MNKLFWDPLKPRPSQVLARSAQPLYEQVENVYCSSRNFRAWLISRKTSYFLNFKIFAHYNLAQSNAM